MQGMVICFMLYIYIMCVKNSMNEMQFDEWHLCYLTAPYIIHYINMLLKYYVYHMVYVCKKLLLTVMFIIWCMYHTVVYIIHHVLLKYYVYDMLYVCKILLCVCHMLYISNILLCVLLTYEFEMPTFQPGCGSRCYA